MAGPVWFMSRQHCNKREREEKETGRILVLASQTVRRFPGCLQLRALRVPPDVHKALQNGTFFHTARKSQKGNGFLSLGFLFFLILTQRKSLASTVQVLRGRSSEKSAASFPVLPRTNCPGNHLGIRIPPLHYAMVKFTYVTYKVNGKSTECLQSSWLSLLLLYPGVQAPLSDPSHLPQAHSETREII